TDDFRFWARIDYLLWWMKNGPLPFPLVTTGNPADAVPGALGQPGTRIPLGDSNIHFDGAYGMRFALGWWFDRYRNIGIEGSFFAKNQCFGAQIGSKLHWERERLSLDLIGKLALGSTRQIVARYGDSTLYDGSFNYFTGGLYAQPSNMGRYTADQFTVIPSMEL